MYYVISIDAHIIACIWIYIYNIHCIPQEHGYNPVFTNISFLRALRLRQGTVTSQRRSESLRDNLNKKKHKQVKLSLKAGENLRNYKHVSLPQSLNNKNPQKKISSVCFTKPHMALLTPMCF